MVKSEHGTMQSSDATFEPREDPETHALKYLVSAEPSAVANSLPKLLDVHLPAIGLSGSNISSSDLLTIPDSGSSIGAAVNTQFFGTQVWGSKFVYVIDRSGSMTHRDRIGAAKRELLASLAKLPPDAQFQVIFYNTDPMLILESTPPKLHFATDHNKLRASRGIEALISEGGTEHLRALQLALTLQSDVVFFLTDADDLRPQDVATATELNKDGAKIHTIEFGLGAAVDQQNQLRELANQNGGSYRYIDAANLNRPHTAGSRVQ
jgi:hypothetical protein